MKKIAARKQVSDLIDFVGNHKDGSEEAVIIKMASRTKGMLFSITTGDGEDICVLEYDQTYSKHFNVVYSEAISGFGPLIYDLALEYVYAQNSYLGCDMRVGVSDEAQTVWNYYLHKRPDVEKKPRFKWSTYKDFLYSIRLMGNFASMPSLLLSNNKSYMLETYPNIFNALLSGQYNPNSKKVDVRFDKLNFSNLWEEYQSFLEDKDEHGFFDWMANQGMFYDFCKPQVTIRSQLIAGIKEGWFRDISKPSISWFKY